MNFQPVVLLTISLGGYVVGAVAGWSNAPTGGAVFTIHLALPPEEKNTG